MSTLSVSTGTPTARISITSSFSSERTRLRSWIMRSSSTSMSSERPTHTPLLHGIRYVEAERPGAWVGRSLDIDALLDLMIHDLNLVLSLLKEEVIEIRAVGVPVLTDKVDITNVRLELANGAVANLTASRVSQDRVRKIRFFGSEAYLSVDTKEQEVKGYRLAGKSVQPIEVTVTKQEPLRAELEAFLGCVRTRTRPLVSGEDGLAAVELAIRVAGAIEESLKRFLSLPS